MQFVCYYDSRDGSVVVTSEESKIAATCQLTVHREGRDDLAACEVALFDGGFTRVSDWTHVNRKDTNQLVEGVLACVVISTHEPSLLLDVSHGMLSAYNATPLAPATTPNEGRAYVMLKDASYSTDGGTTRILAILPAVIPILSTDECTHKVTLCSDCVDTWSIDYLTWLAAPDAELENPNFREDM